MPSARTPQELYESYESAVITGDADAVLALYEQDAVFIGQPGTRSEGVEQIRAALGAFQVLKPEEMTLRPTDVVECGDIALVRSEWSVKGTTPDGEPVEIGGKGLEVLRRQADGSLKFLIDHIFGGA
jgi:uncharacterized protein (TIGR02246 family)